MQGARAKLEAAIGYRFADADRLIAALSHSSLGRRGNARSSGADFERLEFLGDRVVSLAVAEMLAQSYPAENEGDLAKRHAALVRREQLAAHARTIGLGEALTLSNSELQGGGRDNPAVLADAFEALVAAIHLDGGYATAQAVVRRLFEPLIQPQSELPREPKTALQEWAQGRGLGLPVYRVTAQEGLAHAPRFVVEVSVADFPPATAEGTSKRLAERAAALELLQRLEAAKP
ncbi:MAG: ribonuclease III [Telmatospirillum sp.]|nr:ribonuclease III [Telmatospirillum sp.]